MRILLSLLLLMAMIGTSAQEKLDKKNQLLTVFYNVENLFDTEDDPVSQDEEFTPEGSKHWNQQRYEEKLKHLSEVLSSVSSNDIPSLIGLAEVENKQVLKDLCQTGKLRKGDYGIAHFNSSDDRGIDVALLYRPDRFTLENSRHIPLSMDGSSRDILYVKGRLDDGMDLHIFVNHWPSRREGVQESEANRIKAAVQLRMEVDRILNADARARILIMGDLNDEPTNRSVLQMLNASNKRKNAGQRDLYNLMYDKHNSEDKGTISYRGEWQMFDHLIVSFNLIEAKKGYSLSWKSGKIYKEEYMLYDDPNVHQLLPNRTYGGDHYYGGYSDHLPVYLVFTRKEQK